MLCTAWLAREGREGLLLSIQGILLVCVGLCPLCYKSVASNEFLEPLISNVCFLIDG